MCLYNFDIYQTVLTKYESSREYRLFSINAQNKNWLWSIVNFSQEKLLELKKLLRQDLLCFYDCTSPQIVNDNADMKVSSNFIDRWEGFKDLEVRFKLATLLKREKNLLNNNDQRNRPINYGII